MRLVMVTVMVVGCGRLEFDTRRAASVDGAADDATAGADAAGDGPWATSCVGLTDTCGPTATERCCTSPVVVGGTYARSYDLSGNAMYADASYVATVSSFRLDKYEVTVGRFRKFVAAGQGTQASPPVAGAGAHPNIAGSGWDPSWNASLAATTTALVTAIKCGGQYQSWTDAPGGNERRPITCMTWFEAMAFCAWDGGFLPTEAEWNYAAAGGSEQRAYPWSIPAAQVVIDGTRASYWVDATMQCSGDDLDGCAATDLVVVGTKPAGNGRWGQADLGGNVWEWTLDWHASPYPQNPCNDCANLTPGSTRTLRSGRYDDAASFLRSGRREFSPPTDRGNYNTGIRCARSVL